MAASRPRVDTTINYYQVLDVPFGATNEQITRAYRGLMRLTHPDNFQEPADRAKAEERAKMINAAYSVLSKPDTRREYDRLIRITAISDTLMQRYTGNAPNRGHAARPATRPSSARVARARRRAYRSAVRQLLLVTAAFVLAILVLAFALGLLAQTV